MKKDKQNNKVVETIKITIDQGLIDKYADLYFEVHKRATKKPIPYPYHPSLNAWTHLSNEASNAEKQRWSIFIDWVLDKLNLKDKHIEKCEIEFYTYYKTNRRHDCDNGCPKFICDAFVTSGLLVDDDYKHLTSIKLVCDVDTANPRTEIFIRVLE